MAKARKNLLPDGFGASIYAAADDGEITEIEAGMLVRSLLSAGVDTTVTGLGSAIWALATNPGEFEKLKAKPKLARAEADAVLTALANKVSSIDILEEAVWRPNNAIHALAKMTLRFNGK